MVASEPIKPGSALVQVPLDAMMTASTARASDQYGSVAQRLTDWQALSLHVLLERAAGDDSKWSPYINLLPQQAIQAHSPSHCIPYDPLLYMPVYLMQQDLLSLLTQPP